MPLPSLPTDVLCQIFTYCDQLASIIETCHEFAVAAYSTPSLWSNVFIGPRQIVSNGPGLLCAQVGRSGVLPLKVSISLAGADTPNIDGTIVDDMCAVLSKHNGRIGLLQVDTQSAMLAGHILRTVYPSLSDTFPELKSLSVKLKEDPDHNADEWPQLDIYLQYAMSSFPNLQSIAIPTHYDCIPSFGVEVKPFNHLHKLILDGSFEEGAPSMALIVALLHHTPQLETLWLKTLTRNTWVNLSGQTIPGNMWTKRDVPIPVTLHRLAHLAVTAPGAGSDLLGCIEAPGLRDLHLDGSRGPLHLQYTEGELVWSQIDTTRVQDSLKRLSRGSPNLRNLAMTAAYLTEEGWRWLLLGNGVMGPSFPQLESLALRDLEPFSGSVACGFSESLLLQRSMQSSMCLQRLSLRRCTFPMVGADLLRVFINSIERHPTTSHMLEIDSSCMGVTTAHLKGIAEAGGQVSFVDDGEQHEWWAQGHEIDASDSYAYFKPPFCIASK